MNHEYIKCNQNIRNLHINVSNGICEQWNNTLSNGKHVRYEITTYFRWGTFMVELNDQEKEELLKKVFTFSSKERNEYGSSFTITIR